MSPSFPPLPSLSLPSPPSPSPLPLSLPPLPLRFLLTPFLSPLLPLIIYLLRSGCVPFFPYSSTDACFSSHLVHLPICALSSHSPSLVLFRVVLPLPLPSLLTIRPYRWRSWGSAAAALLNLGPGILSCGYIIFLSFLCLYSWGNLWEGGQG